MLRGRCPLYRSMGWNIRRFQKRSKNEVALFGYKTMERKGIFLRDEHLPGMHTLFL